MEKKHTVYTLQEACKLLKISRSTLWRLLKNHKIQSFSYPNSKRVYFLNEEIQRFLNDSSSQTSQTEINV